jgi:methanogenic corrinoid protein MtbC1
MLKEERISIPFIIGGGACDNAFAQQRENMIYAKDPNSVVKILDSLQSRN